VFKLFTFQNKAYSKKADTSEIDIMDVDTSDILNCFSSLTYMCFQKKIILYLDSLNRASKINLFGGSGVVRHNPCRRANKLELKFRSAPKIKKTAVSAVASSASLGTFETRIGGSRAEQGVDVDLVVAGAVVGAEDEGLGQSRD
jgi:hypothetical protein